MFEIALTERLVPSKIKIACKALVSAGLIALAVILPQLIHLTTGQPGGVRWLPMYLPVLIGGCLLGTRWALSVGALSPLMSFVITASIGEPMPAAVRLPFMIAELAVFAAVSGLFSKKIAENGLWAFVAVPTAQLTGRAVFLGLVALFQSVTPLSPAVIWPQITAGLPGLLVQALLVPVFVLVLRRLILKDQHDA